MALPNNRLPGKAGDNESLQTRTTLASFVRHHRHAGCNFAMIDFFCERLLGTYRSADPRRGVALLDR